MTHIPAELNRELVPTEILDAAARGWQVFPLQARTKDGQLLKSWKAEASSDLMQITNWATWWPGCNWGLATGARSGVFVVDVDSDAAFNWAALEKALPISYLVKTGRGFQFYLRQPAGTRVKNSQDEIYPDVDVKGDGGYVVIPPSIHPSGIPYEVMEGGELSEAPEWLIDLVKDTTPDRPAVDLSTLGELSAQDKEFGRNIFLKACRSYAEMQPGGRNAALNNLSLRAGTMIARDCFDAEYAEEKMIDAATENGYIAKDGRSAAIATMTSGLSAGYLKPWEGPLGPEELGVTFGNAPLPPGASLVPLPPVVAGVITMTPEERMLANLATQHSIALIFARRLNEKMLYDHTRKVWMEYDGTRWAVDELKKVHNFILNIASEMNTQNKASMVTSAFCDGVDRHLRSFPEFSRTSKDFDQEHYLLNTPAGTLDLRTGKTRAHDPRDMLTLCTAAAPDTASDGAAFREFMKQITNNDEELIRFHQVSLGACLSGAVEGHWLLFWYGVPRAGKNTLGELVEALMGDYARTIPTSTLMSKKFEGHPTEMANLRSRRTEKRPSNCFRSRVRQRLECNPGRHS
jgi:Bifunctional DNA primase/polymerase, N-terminal/D5 N terminal like